MIQIGTVIFAEALLANCFDFITTVTRINIDKLEVLVVLGLDMGGKMFIFREVFYYPDNEVVDHSRMPGLVLRNGEFRQMMDRVLGRFGGAAGFIFADTSSSTHLRRRCYRIRGSKRALTTRSTLERPELL